MSDAAGTSDTGATAPAGDSGPAAASSEDSGSNQGTGFNPAHEALRTKLGDTTYRLIQDDLRSYDKSAEDRIARSNAELKRYTDLGDFDRLQMGSNLYGQLESSPKDFYDQLAEGLRANGLLEQAAAVEAAADDAEADSDDEDPRIAALREQMEAMQSAQQATEVERLTAVATQTMDATIRDIRGQNSWMSDQDEQRIVANSRNFIEQGQDIDKAIQSAATEYIGLRNDLLSRPRPGDSAPRLVSGSGGNPSAAQPTDVSKMSRTDTQDLVTARLRAMNN